MIVSTNKKRETFERSLCGEHQPAAFAFALARLLDELNSSLISDAPFDHGGREIDRMWYGNDAAIVETNEHCSPVPAWFINGIDVPVAETSRPQDLVVADADDIARAVWGLSRLRPSEDGEYRDVYWRVTRGCALVGDALHYAWRCWVERGHHAAKASNRRASVKWKSIEPDGSVAYLFAAFNDLMPGWKEALPDHLRFKAPKAAVSDTPDYEPPTLASPASAPSASAPGARALDPGEMPEFIEPAPVMVAATSPRLSAVRDLPWPQSLTVRPHYVVPELRKINTEFLSWLDRQPSASVRTRRWS